VSKSPHVFIVTACTEMKVVAELKVRCLLVMIVVFIMAALCNRGPLYFCPVVSFYRLLASFFLA